MESPSPHHHIEVFINAKKFVLDNPVQTGASLKTLAGIPLTDTLFLQKHGEDEVIGNDTTVTLKDGDHLHSQPPADYGRPVSITGEDLGLSCAFEVLPQPDGWTFVVINDYALPSAYTPRSVRLLIKLPPTFPDGQPDMLWVNPGIRTAAGGLPAGTGDEQLLGGTWQRFSWHMKPGAWKPGVSTLRDYMRCVRARFERGN
jgi:Prokaryotic E2 family E/Multiubiquitin